MTCLISLGGDALVDHERLNTRIAAAARAAGVRPIWAISPLARHATGVLDPAAQRRIYPIRPYLAAFDGVISAAGYNSFHELMLENRLPVLFAPVDHALMDDQLARARFAAEQGWAAILDPDRPDADAEVLARFMTNLRQRSHAQGRPAGAEGADGCAEAILDLDRAVAVS